MLMDELTRLIRTDPVATVRAVFGFEAWSKQREILESVRDHKRTAVRSAHGVGKTATAAHAALWFLLAHPGSRVVTTAPTFSQVEELLWREIRRAWEHRDGGEYDIPGKCNNVDLELGADWFAIGLSTDKPERFQGHHAPHMLLVVDEASGVDEAIYEAGEGFLTADGARILLIGNPTKPFGTFYRAFADDSRWNTIHISAFDSPNFTGESVPAGIARALVSPEWVDDFKHTYGEDSPQYSVRVLGEFAQTAGRPYFPQHLLNAFQPVDPLRRGRQVGAPNRGAAISWQTDAAGPITIFELPSSDKEYLVFADVAGDVTEDEWEARPPSDRLDACSAFVVDLATGGTVAEYHAQVDLDVYAADLAKLGYLYKGSRAGALLAVEMNGPGQAVLLPLANMWGYPSLFYRRERDTASGDWTKRLGWRTDMSSRPAMLAALHATLRDRPDLLRSAHLKREMSLFVYDKRGKAQAQAGAHDDRVLARAGACELWRMETSRPRQAPPRKKPLVRQVEVDRRPRVGAT